MESLIEYKDKLTSIVSGHLFITGLIIVFVLIMVIFTYRYSSKISKMVGGKSARKDIDEEELDELIDSINQKQKNCLRAKQQLN